ncbi:MAG: hypothetical protein RMK29_17000 [Myxococcales bacterium]|nr:hypothetical protein [Myxococcota bacterium]MDW8283408.1 hypothetical protein [Myxococcales bacterium]
MNRILAPVLALGLGLLTGCTDIQTGPMADLRPTPDLRTSPGNPALAVACDEHRPCPADPKGGGPARCATVIEFDPVGVCAPSCESDLDCDTDQPGKPFCTIMSRTGKRECVLFCDGDRKLGRECPVGWRCVSSEGFRICQPPQTPATPDMRSDL